MTLIRAVSAGDVSPDTALVEPPSLPALLGKLTLLPLQTVLVTLLSLVLLRPVTGVVAGSHHQVVQEGLGALREVHRLLGHLVVDGEPVTATLFVHEAAGGPGSVVAVEELSCLISVNFRPLLIAHLHDVPRLALEPQHLRQLLLAVLPLYSGRP